MRIERFDQLRKGVSELSLKYALLHKIGIENWIPSNHASKVIVSLAHLMYQIAHAVFYFESFFFFLSDASVTLNPLL